MVARWVAVKEVYPCWQNGGIDLIVHQDPKKRKKRRGFESGRENVVNLVDDCGGVMYFFL